MKIALPIAIATIALSALIWTFFKITTPDAPLTSTEIVFVVCACLVGCLFIQFIWRVLHKERKK